MLRRKGIHHSLRQGRREWDPEHKKRDSSYRRGQRIINCTLRKEEQAGMV